MVNVLAALILGYTAVALTKGIAHHHSHSHGAGSSKSDGTTASNVSAGAGTDGGSAGAR